MKAPLRFNQHPFWFHQLTRLAAASILAAVLAGPAALAQEQSPAPGAPLNLMPEARKPAPARLKQAEVRPRKAQLPAKPQAAPASKPGLRPDGTIAMAANGHEFGYLPPPLAIAAKPAANSALQKPDEARTSEGAKLPPAIARDTTAAIEKPQQLAQEYCISFTNVAAEARFAWQMQQLTDLDKEVRQRIADLDSRRAEYQRWLDRQEEARRKAEDNVVAIFAKMRPEAASLQLAAMDEFGAAAIIAKLNPRTASLFLNEMGPGKAARLTDLMTASVKTDGS